MPPTPRIAAASLSGASDAEWAAAAAPYVDAALLGGIALDEPTRRGARRLVERDREEFLPDDPFEWIDRQLAAASDLPLHPGVNVRATGPDPIERAARICAEHEATLEVNAHCRQPELCEAGAGQTLLREPDRLAGLVRAAAGAGATTSVKVRTEVDAVDLPPVAARCVDAGADWLHVDAMDSEAVVADVVEALGADVAGADGADVAGPDGAGNADHDGARSALVIANNEVRDRESVAEYLDRGADAVSVGRPSTEPAVLERVRTAVEEWFDAEQPTP